MGGRPRRANPVMSRQPTSHLIPLGPRKTGDFFPRHCLPAQQHYKPTTQGGSQQLSWAWEHRSRAGEGLQTPSHERHTPPRSEFRRGRGVGRGALLSPPPGPSRKVGLLALASKGVSSGRAAPGGASEHSRGRHGREGQLQGRGLRSLGRTWLSVVQLLQLLTELGIKLLHRLSTLLGRSTWLWGRTRAAWSMYTGSTHPEGWAGPGSPLGVPAGKGAHLASGLQCLLQGLQLGRGHPLVQVDEEPQHVPLHVLLPGRGHSRWQVAAGPPCPQLHPVPRALRPGCCGYGPRGRVPWGGGEEEAVEEAAAEILQSELIRQQRQVPREQVQEDVAECQVTEGLHCKHSRRPQLPHHPSPTRDL